MGSKDHKKHVSDMTVAKARELYPQYRVYVDDGQGGVDMYLTWELFTNPPPDDDDLEWMRKNYYA
jgi:hypothetical protein